MKNILFIYITLMVVFSMSFSAVLPQGQEDQKKSMEEMQKGVQDFGKALQQMGQAMGTEGNVEPINFRELKKFLPESFGDFKKVSSKGEKNGAFGIKVSEAEGTYTNGSDGSITISIKDMGTLKGFMKMSLAGWAMAEIDKETDDGYERTTNYDGYKAMEEYNSKDKSGEFHVLVGEGIITEIDGDNVTVKDLQDARKSINYKDLEAKAKNRVTKE